MGFERQSYGAWCLLDPPLTVGGADYGAAVRFQSWPAPNAGDLAIVTGVVAAISGTTTKRIVCERALQQSSYTFEGADVPFTFLAGTNVCESHEAQRHYWHNNPAGRLGSFEGRRAQAGHALWCASGAFLVTEAEALAEDPGSVAWQPGESGPGRAPVCAGTTNLATASSSSTSANRLHWHDVVEIHDPNEECALGVGDTFVIKANAMFDSRNPPTVEYDVRDGAGTWATLAGTEYLARWTEGVILIAQSWITSEGWDTTPFCIRVSGVRFAQPGNMPARQINDLAAALDSTDELWWEGAYTLAEGVVPAASGFAAMAFGASEWECDGTYGLRASAWACGESWAGWQGYAVVTGSGTVLPPYYAAGYWTEPSEDFDDTTGTLGCGPGDDLTSQFDIQGDKCVTAVQNLDSGGSVLGKSMYVSCTQTTGSVHESMDVTFNIEGVGFNPEGLLKRIDDGSTILEAVARVQFTGLVQRKQETTIEATGNSAPFNPYHATTYVNGVRTYELQRDASGTVLVNYSASEPSLATEADVTFALIGVTQDTTDVVDVNGTTVSGVPNHRVRALGVGVRSTAEAGKWSLVDVTGAVQGLIDNRDNRITGFYWWPSTGHVSAGASFETMGAFVVSLFGDWSASISYDGSNVRTLSTGATTRQVGWDGIAFDSLHVRWRTPSGAINERRFPLVEPAMIPAV